MENDYKSEYLHYRDLSDARKTLIDIQNKRLDYLSSEVVRLKAENKDFSNGLHQMKEQVMGRHHGAN